MIRNSHNSRGSYAHTGNPAPRWRMVLIALVLALSIGSVSQIAPVKAQDGGTGHIVNFYMELSQPKPTICTGETVHYTATVFERFTSAPPDWKGKNLPTPTEIAGVKVEAYAEPVSLGTFAGAKKAGVVSQQTGFNLDEPYNVVFSFTAGKKPGAGKLIFEGQVTGFNNGYVSSTLSVKVIPCKYEVTTNSTWAFFDQYGTAFFFEFMKAQVTGGAESPVNGSGVVLWVVTEIIPSYLSNAMIHPGSADFKGRFDDNGQLLLNITLNHVSGTDKNCGLPGCGGGPLELEPGPLPLINAPGSGTFSQTLAGNGKLMSGHTSVTVKPLDATK